MLILGMPEALIWTVAVVLLLVGLAGAVLPGLPGAPLILVAAVWLELFLPAYLSWPTMLVLGVLALVSVGLDLALASVGGKVFGGGRAGIVGAAVGGLIGLLFGPLGMLVGAAAGAALAEWRLAGRPVPEALRAGFGAGVGLLAATVAKAGVALLMVALFLLDCFAY